MIKKLSVALLAALSLSVFAQAAAPTATGVATSCESQAMSKKLAGAAKNSFMKKCEREAGAGAEAPKSQSAQLTCEKNAVEKKLAGAAKNSFVKKCVADAASAGN